MTSTTDTKCRIGGQNLKYDFVDDGHVDHQNA